MDDRHCYYGGSLQLSLTQQTHIGSGCYLVPNQGSQDRTNAAFNLQIVHFVFCTGSEEVELSLCSALSTNLFSNSAHLQRKLVQVLAGRVWPDRFRPNVPILYIATLDLAFCETVPPRALDWPRSDSTYVCPSWGPSLLCAIPSARFGLTVEHVMHCAATT
eukprot:840319-Amphidinium_carterae.1